LIVGRRLSTPDTLRPGRDAELIAFPPPTPAGVSRLLDGLGGYAAAAQTGCSTGCALTFSLTHTTGLHPPGSNSDPSNV